MVHYYHIITLTHFHTQNNCPCLGDNKQTNFFNHSAGAQAMKAEKI